MLMHLNLLIGNQNYSCFLKLSIKCFMCRKRGKLLHICWWNVSHDYFPVPKKRKFIFKKIINGWNSGENLLLVIPVNSLSNKQKHSTENYLWRKINDRFGSTQSNLFHLCWCGSHLCVYLSWVSADRWVCVGSWRFWPALIKQETSPRSLGRGVCRYAPAARTQPCRRHRWSLPAGPITSGQSSVIKRIKLKVVLAYSDN